MAGIATSRAAPYWNLIILYFAQGISMGFIFISWPAYLASIGYSKSAIGQSLAISILPWSLKWVLGPLVDKYQSDAFGRRRSWILVAQLGMAVPLAFACFSDNFSVGVITSILLVHNLFAAIQDIATDGYAIDTLSPISLGKANGMMALSKTTAVGVGSVLLTHLISTYGLRVGLGAQSLIMLTLALAPLRLKETAQPRQTSNSLLRVLRNGLLPLFSKNGFWFTLFGLLVFVHKGIFDAVAPVLAIKDLGWDQQHYSSMSGGIGAGATACGAILAGFIVDRIGIVRVFAVSAAITAVSLSVLPLTLNAGSNDLAFSVTICMVKFCEGAILVAQFTLGMKLSRENAASATYFALLMSICNLSISIGFQVSSLLSERIDSQGILLLAGVCPLVASIPLFFIKKEDGR